MQLTEAFFVACLDWIFSAQSFNSRRSTHSQIVFLCLSMASGRDDLCETEYISDSQTCEVYVNTIPAGKVDCDEAYIF